MPLLFALPDILYLEVGIIPVLDQRGIVVQHQGSWPLPSVADPETPANVGWKFDVPVSAVGLVPIRVVPVIVGFHSAAVSLASLMDVRKIFL